MQEGNALALSADPWGFVYESETGVAAALQHAVEVVHGETHVMDSGATFGDILADRGILGGGLQQFHQRFPGGEPDDGRAVGITERDLGHLEHITHEGQQLVDGAYGDPDVGDARAAANGLGHGGLVRVVGDRIRILIPHSEDSAGGPVRTSHGATMANAVEVKDDTFATEIEQHQGLAVVDFWATWCAPCRMIAPIVEQLAVDYQGKAKVAKLDVDNNQRTAARFNVRSIPTILFFKDGKLVDQVVGAVPRPALEAKFKEHV